MSEATETTMDMYVLGLLCTMLLMICFCVGSLIFLSYDQRFDGKARQQGQTGRFAGVKRIDTDTIETVDLSGIRQTWQRQDDLTGTE